MDSGSIHGLGEKLCGHSLHTRDHGTYDAVLNGRSIHGSELDPVSGIENALLLVGEELSIVIAVAAAEEYLRIGIGCAVSVGVELNEIADIELTAGRIRKVGLNGLERLGLILVGRKVGLKVLLLAQLVSRNTEGYALSEDILIGIVLKVCKSIEVYIIVVVGDAAAENAAAADILYVVCHEHLTVGNGAAVIVVLEHIQVDVGTLGRVIAYLELDCNSLVAVETLFRECVSVSVHPLVFVRGLDLCGILDGIGGRYLFIIVSILTRLVLYGNEDEQFIIGSYISLSSLEVKVYGIAHDVLGECNISSARSYGLGGNIVLYSAGCQRSIHTILVVCDNYI